MDVAVAGWAVSCPPRNVEMWMQVDGWALIVGGGLVLAGVAYPRFAEAQSGWKVGSWAGGTAWSVWFGLGAIAYLAGMWSLFGWLGALSSLPVAFFVGLAMTLTFRRHIQLLALAGPILTNVWFMSG